MTTYTTGRKSYWPHILKQWSIAAGIFFIIILYDQLFGNDFINISDTFYWAGAILLLAQYVDLISRKRVYKIVIDETSKTITQYYRSPMSGEGEKIHSLDKAQLYVKSKVSAAGGGITTQSLELYKSLRLVLDLDPKKDGFSPATLQEIRVELERLLVPVTG